MGYYEVLGGVIGCLVLGILAFQRPEIAPGGVQSLATLPFVLLLSSGLALARGAPAGLPLSLALQTAQLVAWSYAGSVWKFAAGIYASVGIVDGRINFFAGWDTSLLVGRQLANEPPALILNVVPIVLLTILLRRFLEQRRYTRSLTGAARATRP